MYFLTPDFIHYVATARPGCFLQKAPGIANKFCQDKVTCGNGSEKRVHVIHVSEGKFTSYVD